jgi:disulfide bond formation protein DsbB
MWLHLGGSYWQRASVDAVIVISALFGLVAFAKSLKELEKRHFWGGIALIVVLLGFAVSIYLAGNHLGHEYGAKLQELESASSP